jgi:hypothetical protein
MDRYQVQTVPTALKTQKRLGTYLEEAGLINRAQIEVALNDQQATGLRFGEVLAARGWVKQQTIEYLMKKVVIPERRQAAPAPPPPPPLRPLKSTVQPSTVPSNPQPPAPSRPSPPPQKNDPLQRRDVPISKPLPSVPSSDGDVNWVG